MDLFGIKARRERRERLRREQEIAEMRGGPAVYGGRHRHMPDAHRAYPSPGYSPMNDPISPLNPASPLSVYGGSGGSSHSYSCSTGYSSSDSSSSSSSCSSDGGSSGGGGGD